MPDEIATDAHQRFAHDLRRIRESYGLNVDDLHQATKIPRDLITEFEENALVGHSMFNRVYLRSLVRAYAQQLDLSPKFALRALEKARDDNYSGELADEYLDTEPASAEEDVVAEEEAESEATEEEQAAEPVAAEEATAAESAPTEEEEVSSEHETPREGQAEEQTEPEATGRKEERASEELQHEATGAAGTGAAAGAASGSKPAGEEKKRSTPERGQRSSRSRRSGSRKRSRSGGTPGWVWGLVGIAALVGVGLLLYFLLSGNGKREQEAGAPVAAQDTSSQSARQAATQPAPEPVQIGDSLDFRVTAARGPVRELRVKPDDDLRRPYWINEGASKVFRAQNKIIFQNAIDNPNLTPLQNIDLELEGKTYPTDRRDAQGRIVVSRQSAQAYLDSLARQ